MVGSFAQDGVTVFDAAPSVLAWAQAAHRAGLQASFDPDVKAQWLRHGGTWFVGVDALPNDPDGAIGAVPLKGPWARHVDAPRSWHRAQVSVIYDGYPKQDAGESDAAHRFRVNRCAAHVDGLHLEAGRRILREPHAFILGIALNSSAACPLVVWPGSHLEMGRSIGVRARKSDDVTEAYTATRKQCFAAIQPVEVPLEQGQSVLLHRHLLHGIAPWKTGDVVPSEGRMTAYFRPYLPSLADW